MLMRYFEHIAAACATIKIASESFCRSYPAVCVRRASSGRTNLQSSPSNKAANIAGDISITPSAIVGQTNLQPSRRLCTNTRPVRIPEQNLDPVRSFRSEHEGCAAERIETEPLLHLCRKPIVATAEVDRPHCNVNLQISTGRNHRDARTARITRESCSPSMSVSVRSTTSPIAISSLIAGV